MSLYQAIVNYRLKMYFKNAPKMSKNITQVSGKGSDKKKMYKLYGLQILKVHITMVKKR